jgi:hypothetical protein
MTQTPRFTRPIRFALVASLMLGASPILAQVSGEPIPTPAEAAPAAVIAPAPAPAIASPTPVIVVPDVAPSATTVTPTIEPVATPEPPPPVARSAAPEPAAAPATRPVARAAAPAEDAARGGQLPAVEPVIAERTAPPPEEPIAVPLADAAPAPANDNASNDNTWGLVATASGVLAILILAIWGFVSISRRKTPFERSAVPVIDRPAVAPREIVPAPVHPAAVQPSPLVASGGTHAGLPHAGASVALPRTLPESFAEREALLKRMVAAKPDRANPFTERRARAKRARLILQSLGRDFGDARPWIDLSQYPNNWPELARHTSAAA